MDGGIQIKNKDPEQYTDDLRSALDAFEAALLQRYENELDDHNQVWTPHGMEPDPPPEANAGPGPDTVRIGYDRAKRNAPDWAAEARAEVESYIPVYDAQDLYKIEVAFTDLKEAEALLLSELGEGGGLPDLTSRINNGSASDSWEGPSGDRFRENFGITVTPTRDNQGRIVVSLYDLYAGRAGIVEAARSSTLRAIKKATSALEKTADSGEENARWLSINAAIIAVGVASTGWGTGAAIAATIGGYLDSSNPDQEYAEDIQSIVMDLEEDLFSVVDDCNVQESDWADKSAELQMKISDVPSDELELYDFTSSGGDTGDSADGYHVDPDAVFELAALCFEAGMEYEKVITRVIRTEETDRELKGRDNEITEGDNLLKETRNALISFLQTTCARYYEAGYRLHNAAEAYVEIDASNERAADVIAKALDDLPDLNGDGRGNGGSVDDHLQDTDRDDIQWGEEVRTAPAPQRVADLSDRTEYDADPPEARHASV